MKLSLALAFLLLLSATEALVPSSTNSNLGSSNNKKGHKFVQKHQRRHRFDFKDWHAPVTRAISASVVTISLTLGNPAIPPLNVYPHTAVARVVAPLADVGLREFLVKDGNTFLRLNLPTSLPTTTNPEVLGDTGRHAQEAIELVRLRLEQVGFSGRNPVWNACLKDVVEVETTILATSAAASPSSSDQQPLLLQSIPGDKHAKGEELLSSLKEKLPLLEDAVKKQEITNTLSLQEECSVLLYNLRVLSMPAATLPYTIPEEYSQMPILKGRAVVECTIVKSRRPFLLSDGSKAAEVSFPMLIDGYHAPITAGNFIDLVQRKFYDELIINSAEELIIQTGNPYGAATNGFLDPKTAEKRVIPLELFYKKDKEPTYGYTSDDDMRPTDAMANPFQAYGAIGFAHESEDVNTGSSQFWFLKWDQALVAPGRNTLDGSQASMGYVVKNQELLDQIQKGDLIKRIQVVEGLENFSANGSK